MKRIFLPENFEIKTWNDIAPFFEILNNQAIENLQELEHWMLQRSELEAYISEDLGKRYIAMTCDTSSEIANENYSYFTDHIQPMIAPFTNLLDKKLMDNEFLNQLNQDTYHIYLRSVKMNMAIYRDENVPLFTDLNNLSQQFSGISAAMSVTINDNEMTLQQAAKLLQSNDRKLREEVYKKISDRRLQDKNSLDDIMNKMVSIRHQIAINAGYSNFRDYMFDALGRFDYSPADCFNFHESVKKYIVPILDKIDASRKDSLGYEQLKPYDFEVDIKGLDALKPFDNAGDLVAKTLTVFDSIDPYFAECLNTMQHNKLLDLESRKGKAPGGYLYPLPESGVPFIFMNAVGSLRDLVTMVHEGGHAIHSFLSKDLILNDFKNCPSEVAELASMSMELFTMQHWQEFFNDTNDLKRAKAEQLDDILRTLPWVAAIDKFQHWMYLNPTHTVSEREQQWINIYSEFGGKQTNWDGLEEVKANLWQKQLHLFEVPFYYIEYGFAQLGAIAMWKNYLQNPFLAIEKYKNALSLGYTKSIGEIYQAAGIKFEFSENYINSLASFVQQQITEVEAS